MAKKIKIKSLRSGERFKVKGSDTLHQLMDSGEGEVFYAGMSHNRLICGTVSGSLTVREASFVKQTLSNGDYFDYNGRIHTLVVLPQNEIHDTIVKFIAVKSNW